LIDHSQSMGKKRTYTYHGPDKIFLQLGEDGREKYGPLTADDLSDGRPLPIDCHLFEVKAVDHPLICQLRGPVINDLQEAQTEKVYHPQSPMISGYRRFTYILPLLPGDVYDKFSIKIENDEIKIDTWSVWKKLLDKEEPLTWDDVRKHRDQLLSSSDSRLPPDAPEDLKAKWLDYRQKLRDLPSVMQANNVPPSIAFYMFPWTPDDDIIED